MPKGDVYSWRLDRETKRALEEAARRERGTVASLLSRIVHEWLRSARPADDEAEQASMRAAAMRWVGRAPSGHTDRSERVRDRVRARLKARRAG